MKRRSRWVSSLAALQYISDAHNSPDAKTRRTDSVTNLCLATAIVLATLCLLLPGARQNIFWFCNLFVGITIVFYIANRFGVITTFTPRQAILISQLLLACIVLGIYIAVNFSIWIFWLRSFISGI